MSLSHSKGTTIYGPTVCPSGPSKDLDHSSHRGNADAFRHYLIRHEIIAMHRPNEPQAYPVCFQANVKSSGTLRPTDTVKFPDAYNLNDNFKRFNLYWGDDFNKFVPPGPAVFNRNAAQPPASTPAPAPSASPSPTSPGAVLAPIGGTSAAAAASNSAGSGTGKAPTCRRSRKRVIRALSH